MIKPWACRLNGCLKPILTLAREILKRAYCGKVKRLPNSHVSVFNKTYETNDHKSENIQLSIPKVKEVIKTELTTDEERVELERCVCVCAGSRQW